MTYDYDIWLYGSRARGDADDFSDTDLLVIGYTDAGLASVRRDHPYTKLNLSYYDWREIENMWSYGSLFLLHISMEGIRVRRCIRDPDRLDRLLRTLPQFRRAAHDLAGFRLALQEARASLADGGWPDLELQVAATVVRHAAILGCYCIGQPAFGRERPFFVIGERLGYGRSELEELATWATQLRYATAGTAAWPQLEDDGLRWLLLAQQFVEDLGEVIDGYERVLPEASAHRPRRRRVA